MKKLLTYTIIMLLGLNAYAQQNPTASLTVKGLVIDSATNQPASFATTVLQDANTHQSVRSTLTKDNGTFELTAPAGKAYDLAIVFVGYRTKLIHIDGKNSVYNFDKLLISPSNKNLSEVSITAAKPLMKQEIDRLSYDVKADPEAPVLTALDMMRKVPLLSVDGQDNILLKGDGNYKILINGKESALIAKNPSDILKSMPATNIEKIEVITTPPAKYDAEGLTGIINIITKQDLSQGYNVSISGRENSIFGPGINLNGTLKKGKFGISTYMGLSHNANPVATSGSTQTFLQQQSTLTQSSVNTYNGNNGYGDIELSYEIDTLNLVTAAFDAFVNRQFTTTNQVSAMTNALGVTDQFYNLSGMGSNPYVGLDISVNYQLGFAHQKGRLLTFSYKFSSAPDNQNTSNVFSQRLNYPQSLAPDYNQYNADGSNVHTLQLDYVHPHKKLTVEAGAKAILRDNFSNYHVDDRDSVTNRYITNAAQTNDFNYQQDVYGLYNSYQLQLEHWGVKAGLRLEHTMVNADFTSTASTVKENYDNLIPSVSVQRKFETSSFNLGFTERIQRPGIYQLNPFVNRTNPSYISFGNPDLRPEINHTIDLTYSNYAKQSVTIGLSYAFSNNSIQSVSGLQVTNLAGKLDTVTTSTYQNLGSRSRLGGNLNTTINFTKEFSVNLNGVINEVWLTGAYNGALYKNNGLQANLFTNIGYTFGTSGYRLGFSGGYFTGNITLQGKTSSGTYSSPVITKTFLNKMASVGLAVNNPFAKFQTLRSTTTTPQYITSTFNEGNYRSFAIRFNYRFGKLDSDIKKNERPINGDDTGGGKN